MKKQILKTTMCLLMLALSACSAQKLDKSVDDPGEAETSTPYTLVRDWKRVIRYDCNGAVTSDQNETVSSPKEFISIPPKTRDNIYGSEFLNVTTNSSPGYVGNLSDFNIDMSPTWLDMQVNEGINQITYSFSYCTSGQRDDKGICTVPLQVLESGTLYIKVVYTQTQLDGFDEVHPTADDCKPPPKKIQ